MKLFNKKGNEDEGTSYWISFSDLMSGLLIVFILLFIFKLFDYQSSLEQKEQIIQQITDTRGQIVEKLQEEFDQENMDMQIDPKTGAITLSEGILFDFGKSELKNEGKVFLQNFIPVYMKKLMEDPDIRDNISQIIIEGHTDNEGDIGGNQYLFNLKLSQERAYSVSEYVLSNNIQYEYKENLQTLLTANGRSYSDPVYNDDNSINNDKSRRVEIKFRLKEEEALLRIQQELEK